MATTPMLAPDGSVGDVPNANVNDAVASGFKIGQDMIAPDGQHGTIPLENVHDAVQAGFQIAPPAGTPSIPNPRDQYTNPGTQTNEIGNPVTVPAPGESFADTMTRAAQQGQRTPQSQIDAEMATAPGKAATVLAAAPAIGAAGAGALAAAAPAENPLPSVMANTISGVKAIGAWAQANPLHAYIVFNLLKELVPGAKKAMGLIKEAPVGGEQ